MPWEVIARDPDLRRRGYLPTTKVTFDHRHRDVSAWTVEMTGTRPAMARLGPGWGAILLRDGLEIMSGPLEDDGPRSWSAGDDGKIGRFTVTYADDAAIVAGELAYPDPTKAAADQTGGVAYDTRSGPAETVIKGYVGDNVGTARAAARGDASALDVRLVTVAEDLGRGDSVQFSARFHKLTDIAKAIALAGTDIGFDVIQDIATNELVFDCYQPRDLSRRLRFSRATGNLISSSTTDSMPTTTHAVVLGAIPTSDTTSETDPSKQPIVERQDSTAANDWRMIVRQVVDSSGTSDTTEMQQAGDAALADGRRQYATDVVIVETAQVRYPFTIRRGDVVTVVDPLRDGRTITAPIMNVHGEIDMEAGTEQIRFDVGTTDTTSTGDDLTDLVKVLKKQVQALQRRT